jgi:hypothetical protein
MEITSKYIQKIQIQPPHPSVEQSTETNYLSKSKSNPPIFYLSKSIRQKSYLSKSKKVLMKKLLFK